MVSRLTSRDNKDVQKLTFYVHVYAAIIPYKTGQNASVQKEEMENLRNFFQQKSDMTTDPEMLSLFALPYVPDPATHPVFSKLFQVHTITSMRK